MDLSLFLDKCKTDPSYAWTSEPCLYIVKSDASANVYRCGASGTHLYPDNDPVYTSSTSIQGLQSRMTMYINYWLPVGGKIYAALTIQKKLVATSSDRISALGYNISRPTRTLVLEREKEFHAELDKRQYRWDKGKHNELFISKSAQNLISALRTIQGERFFTFDESGFSESVIGRRSNRAQTQLIDTVTRKTPERTVSRTKRTPTLTVKLDKTFIKKLRDGSKHHYNKLLDIIETIEEEG